MQGNLEEHLAGHVLLSVLAYLLVEHNGRWTMDEGARDDHGRHYHSARVLCVSSPSLSSSSLLPSRLHRARSEAAATAAAAAAKKERKQTRQSEASLGVFPRGSHTHTHSWHVVSPNKRREKGGRKKRLKRQCRGTRCIGEIPALKNTFFRPHYFCARPFVLCCYLLALFTGAMI